MSTNYPTTLDTLSNPTSGDPLNNPDHAGQHANANDAIEALEAKVGANSSAVTTSHDYKLSEVTGTDKAVGKTATQTLTNKTLTSPAINLSSNATGDIYYRDSGGTFQRLPIGTSTQILSVSTGGIPEWITNANATAPNYFTAVADENLTIGQPVGVSNYVTGLKVARALRYLSLTASLSFTSSNGLNKQGNRAVPIGGDKFVFLDTQTSDDSLYATVGTVATGTKTITLGTSVAVTADIFNEEYNICKLDTDKFIVFYREDASLTIIKYRVGTVSGTTITFGSATTFTTGADTVSYIVCDQISTDKGVMFYAGATTTNSRIIAFTVSGTTATAGTPIAIGTTIDDNLGNGVGIKKVATDKFIFCADTGGATSNLCQVGTISGTTITLGTETAFSTTDNMTSSTYGVRIVNPSDNVVVIQHTNNSNIGETVVGTISGTTPTFGTPVTGNQYDHWIYADTSSSVLVGNVNNDWVSKFTFSGTTLTSIGKVIYALMSSAQYVLGMDSGYFIALNSNSTSLSYYIQGMSNNFVGIAQGTVSKGASVVVITGGIDSNQSGLIPGGQYLVDAGTLTFSSNTATQNTVNDKYLLALSATQVLI